MIKNSTMAIVIAIMTMGCFAPTVSAQVGGAVGVGYEVYQEIGASPGRTVPEG